MEYLSEISDHLLENSWFFIHLKKIEKEELKNANPTSITVNFFPFIFIIYHLMIVQPQISKVIIDQSF